MNLRKRTLSPGKTLFLLALIPCLPIYGQQPGNASGHWPMYRGAHSNGVAASITSITPWSEGQAPPQVWRRPLGEAFSGLTFSDNMLITGFSEDSTEFLGAFDPQSGEEIWRYKMNKLYVEEFGNGPRATPAVDAHRVYMFDSWGVMHGVDLNTGKGLWKNPLAQTFKLKSAQNRGFCASPILLDGVIIQFVSGLDSTAFMGLDCLSGHVLWRKGSALPTFSSPALTEILGEKQAIFSSGRVIMRDGKRRGHYETTALNAKGETLWTGPGLPGIITMPIGTADNQIFVASQGRWGSMTLSISKENGKYKAEKLWNSRNMRTHFNSAVFHNGFIYGFSNATLECLNAENGERQWRQRGLGKSSLIVLGHRLLILSDKGKVFLVEATPAKYNELAAFQAIEGKSWTAPTFVNGKLYVRNQEEMACYDLSK